MVVEGWRQRGHNEGTSLREDAGYDEKCRDEKTQVRNVAEELPQGRGCPALFHPGVTQWQATTTPGHRRARCHDDQRALTVSQDDSGDRVTN
jgi:hypothetical protein